MGISGPICFVATSCMYTMSRCILARHTHLEVLHLQRRIHDGMVLS